MVVGDTSSRATRHPAEDLPDPLVEFVHAVNRGPQGVIASALPPVGNEPVPG